MAGMNRYYCSSYGYSDDDDDDDDDGEEEGEGTAGEEDYDDDDDCSSCSTAEADDAAWTRRRPRRARSREDSAGASAAEAVAAAAAATAPDLLDARRLADLLDPARLVTVLDGCLGAEYVRGCVVETWDAGLSDHLEAVAHLVLYQTPEHAVSQFVYDQLTELSAALRPPDAGGGQRPARVDADRVYGSLRSAARALLATAVDACCRQGMCRAVGLAVVALRASTRPVFTVENFTVEINEAADFANLYCGAHARRICAALKDIYDAVMAGEYHPTNVLVQMAVMEKSIRAALRTLADAHATAAQKTAAQRSLLAELDGISATVRMKNHGCVQQDDGGPEGAERDDRRAAAVAWARGHGPAFPAAARLVHFTMSPWRAPIRMYHQQSPVSMDRVLRTTVSLVEALVSELFKPCLGAYRGRPRPLRRRGHAAHRRQQRRDCDVHEKQL